MLSRINSCLGLGQRGQNVVEGLMVVASLAIAAQATALIIRTASKQNVANRDRAYATEKALQMFEELRELVADEQADVTILNKYADPRAASAPYLPAYKYSLTSKWDHNHDNSGATLDAAVAGDGLSGNPVRVGGFAFVRAIDVAPDPKDKTVAKVWVKVYAAARNAGPGTTVSPMPQYPSRPPLAEIYGVMHSLGTPNHPRQVVDVYLIALESVPGWWSRLSQGKPLLQATFVNLQSRNPGLEFRQHWITTMSFGRDLEYTPESNSGSPASTANALKKTYVYPGQIDCWADNAGNPTVTDDFYFTSNWLARLNMNSSVINNSNTGPGLGYPVADQFNHAMRYPDEQNLYNILGDIATNRSLTAGTQQNVEMSYRMLLEKLNNGDPSLRNAIFVNLHGEMCPIPPLRNYSDAAKDPTDYWPAGSRGAGLSNRAFRAVTHPERLAYSYCVSCAAHCYTLYPSCATCVTACLGGIPQALQALNVYAYDAKALDYPTDAINNTYEADTIDQVTIFIKGADLSNLRRIERVEGSSTKPYYRNILNSASWTQAGLPTASADPGTIQDSSSGAFSYVYDGGGPLNENSNNFIADEYSPDATRRGIGNGLRIRLYNVTPTARLYHGPQHP